MLAQATPGLPDTPLEKEFQRCVAEAVPKQPPCLLLFRTDQRENVEGCRWLMVVWLPSTAPEAECAMCVHSRGLLAKLVPQPYFLRELFACGPHQLTWRAACEANAESCKEAAGRRAPHARLHCAPPGSTAAAVISGPVTQAPTLQGLLERLVRREDHCIRLVLMASARVTAGGLVAPPTLEAKVCESRSPAHLAKAGLPAGACYFVMYSKDDLAFIHWCPESMSSKDTTRIHDDARYAILKAAVLSIVAGAFPSPQPRVLQVNAREPQDIVDGINRATAPEASTAPALPLRLSGRSQEGERSWPAPGAVADWPDHWPSAASSGTAPVSLVLPQRPVPPWRGGARTGTISALAASPASSAHRAKVTKIGTTHFRDLH